jgi:hypothetical protein
MEKDFIKDDDPCTVKKATRDAGLQHEGDGKFRQPHRPSGLYLC